jgi:hypothetical protein
VGSIENTLKIESPSNVGRKYSSEGSSECAPRDSLMPVSKRSIAACSSENRALAYGARPTLPRFQAPWTRAWSRSSLTPDDGAWPNSFG